MGRGFEKQKADPQSRAQRRSHVRGFLRACFKIAWGPAARDFGCGQGGEGASARVPASPQRAGTAEPTPAAAKRPALVFAEKAAWLRCSSVEDPPGIFSFVAPRHSAFSAKTGPHGILKQALRVRSKCPNSSAEWSSAIRQITNLRNAKRVHRGEPIFTDDADSGLVSLRI